MMDPIKKAIAGAIQRKAADLVIREDLPIREITTNKISDLETTIRVVTQNQGTRYFTVKVSERY